MPIIRNNHRRRALFEQRMADRSATNMARIIHQQLATMHAAEANACAVDVSPKGSAQ